MGGQRSALQLAHHSDALTRAARQCVAAQPIAAPLKTTLAPKLFADRRALLFGMAVAFPTSRKRDPVHAFPDRCRESRRITRGGSPNMNGTVTARSPRSGGPASRDAMITRHLGLVYHVARALARSGAGCALELDELVSAGTLGLIEALDHFDTSRGLAFSTFAAPRIRGAMLDELRRQDVASRSLRRKSRDLAAASESLAHRLGREATSAELAGSLGIDLPTLWRWRAEEETLRQVPLERSVEDEDERRPFPLELIATSDDDAIDERLTREREVEQLRDALLELPEQERIVLSLSYLEDLRLHEIAELLGVSESRVSQVRAKALRRLRGKLGSLRSEVA
jgi:RNA polymerase sigma factor for flagellar operon FliA